MKTKQMIAAIALLILIVWILAAYPGEPSRITTMSASVDLTMATADDNTVLYVLYPTEEDNWYVSETAPSLYRTGTVRRSLISFYGNTYFCTSSDSADTLVFVASPLVYDPDNLTFAVVPDTFNLVMDVAGTSTADSTDTLLTTASAVYGVDLSAVLPPTSGFAITIYNTQSDSIMLRSWLYGIINKPQ